jgi:dipeptidyl aminopeptidase/acylaminoacyl peptidase
MVGAVVLVLLLGAAAGGWGQPAPPAATPAPGAAVEENPQAQAALTAALALKRDRKFEAALEQFRAALKIDPNFADAYWGAAWCYVALGNEDAAIEAFRYVIRLAPETDNGVEAAKAIERLRARHAPPPEAPEPQTFLIALSMVRGGQTHLYLADDQGVVRRQLTSDPGEDTQPAFSGDAHQIVFASTRGGNKNLWEIKADGTGLKQLTDDTSADYAPTWSPKSNAIVFVSDRSGKPALYQLDAVTGETTALEQGSSQDLTPAWSPNGDALAFVSDRDGVGKIYIWDATSRVAHKLLANTIPEKQPVWSPDAQYLYFTWKLEGNQQICRAGPGGGGLESVAPSPDNQRLWGISPTGDLLLSSDRTGSARLYLRPAQGGEEIPVGQGDLEIVSAAVSPALPRSVAEILFTSKPPVPAQLPPPPAGAGTVITPAGS